MNICMTRQKKRYYVSSFSDEAVDTQLELYKILVRARDERFSNLPTEVSSDIDANALFSHNEILLFEVAMLLRNHTIMDVAELYDIPYRPLSRASKKFNRGQMTRHTNKVEKTNAYVISQIIKYIDDTTLLLEDTLMKGRDV